MLFSNVILVSITIGMPNVPYVYADDFLEILETKHAMGTYDEMVKGFLLLIHC